MDATSPQSEHRQALLVDIPSNSMTGSKKQKVVIYQRYEIDEFKGWLIYQAKTLNLSNIALLVIVAVVSSSISSTLTRLQDQNDRAAALLNQTQSLLIMAQPLKDEMDQLNTSLAMIQSGSRNYTHNVLLAHSNPSEMVGPPKGVLSTFSWTPESTSEFATVTPDNTSIQITSAGYYRLTYRIDDFDSDGTTIPPAPSNTPSFFYVSLGFVTTGESDFDAGNRSLYQILGKTTLIFQNVDFFSTGQILTPAVNVQNSLGPFKYFVQHLIVERLPNLNR